MAASGPPGLAASLRQPLLYIQPHRPLTLLYSIHIHSYSQVWKERKRKRKRRIKGEKRTKKVTFLLCGNLGSTKSTVNGGEGVHGDGQRNKKDRRKILNKSVFFKVGDNKITRPSDRKLDEKVSYAL